MASSLKASIIGIAFNHLGIQPEEPIWHPTCNREGRRTILAPRDSRARAASPWASLANLLAFRTVQSTHITIQARPGVPEWSPTLPPNLEEVIMNHRLVIALPLAAVLALPALAQTTDQSQPANTQQTQ